MVEFKLDRAGIGEVLKSSEMAGAVSAAADAIAANLPADVDVYLEPFTSDRAGVTIGMAGRNIAGREAKNGEVSGAARAAGLDFRGRP